MLLRMRLQEIVKLPVFVAEGLIVQLQYLRAGVLGQYSRKARFKIAFKACVIVLVR